MDAHVQEVPGGLVGILSNRSKRVRSTKPLSRRPRASRSAMSCSCGVLREASLQTCVWTTKAWHAAMPPRLLRPNTCYVLCGTTQRRGRRSGDPRIPAISCIVTASYPHNRGSQAPVHPTLCRSLAVPHLSPLCHSRAGCRPPGEGRRPPRARKARPRCRSLCGQQRTPGRCADRRAHAAAYPHTQPRPMLNNL
jgi:hypothetical protein